jgi:hypothetical protein
VKNNFEIIEDIVEIECKRHNGNIIKTRISLDDFDKVSKFEGTWFAHSDSKSGKIYIRGNTKDEKGNNKMLLLHRIITDCPESLVANHLSGTLDNTRENLEVTTIGENNAHGRYLVEVFIRQSKKFSSKSWFKVVWLIDKEIEFPASYHSTKEEALVRKMILEARQKPELLEYVDYNKKFKELGYEWSLVPFEKWFGDIVPKLLIGREIQQLKRKECI